MLPTATIELVVTLRDDGPLPVICGAHSESFVIDTAARPALVGVHFKPGGAGPRHGSGVARAVERAVDRHPAVAYALDAIEPAPHVTTIGRLTERIGLSARRFIELFAAQVGLTPKVFCRVRRFQRALALIERDTDVDWIEVALAGGYYDQAHFIHDFRAFSGVNPTTYVRARGSERNHIPLAGQPQSENRA